MKRLAFQALSLATILTLCGVASAGSVQAGFGRITNLVLAEGDGALRIGVAFEGAVVNPANCNIAAGLALQLNAAGRSAEETRAMVNTAQLAFMTNRRVGFAIRDDLCLTLGGAAHRVLTAIDVLY